MKLSEWLDTPNPDGSRKVRGDFATKIGVTPQMISDRSITGSMSAPSRLYWPVTRAAIPSA